jgi:hypothetical protein
VPHPIQLVVVIVRLKWAEVGVSLPANVTITAGTAVVVGSDAGCTYNCDPSSAVITVASGTCYAP